MITDMEKEKRDTYGRIDSKYRKLVELTKQQMGLRRLIKRNRKKEEALNKVKSQQQKDEDKAEKVVKAPFVVASYV